ncbi:MAG: hypothetical protein KDD43_10690, partial [Bdellovibrionales bacterium]|nr:hypothetical protein [Bdellovibrionales bacterium]
MSNSSTCADAMAAADTGPGTLAEKKAKAQRNLNAMLRLASWTKYNRRKWTDITTKFDGLFVTFTPGVGEWQERLLLDGEVSNMAV